MDATGAFRAVYASRDEVTALDEAQQQNLRLGVPTWMALPLVVTALEVDLEPILDLTDSRVRRVLRVSVIDDNYTSLLVLPHRKMLPSNDH